MLLLDALIARAIRYANRRILAFPESDTVFRLPTADPQRRYLLYLHIPYCVVLCPFCSFHRVRFNEGAARRYFECLRREIDLVGNAGYRFDELYVGGGTPTVIPGELIRTLEQVRGAHPLVSISVETNPDDIEKESVRRLRDAGVNRLSVGVQSFDDTLLREMQRYDKFGSGRQIAGRLERQKRAFDTLNVDMIFNFPHQTEASLENDLQVLVDEIQVDQVSWYPLMAAASMRRSMRQHMGTVDYARERRFYELIAARMLDAGYTRNSAWCFSRKHGLYDEYIVDRDEYVGLGSGAFSYIDGRLTASTFSIDHYLRLVDADMTGMVRERTMNERDRMRYFLMMQLFAGKLDLVLAEARFEGRFRETLWPELTVLKWLRAVCERGNTLALTERGQYLWVIMMREFFAGVSDLRDEMRHHVSEENRVELP